MPAPKKRTVPKGPRTVRSATLDESHTPLTREGTTCELRFASGEAYINLTWRTGRVGGPLDKETGYHGTLVITGAAETTSWKLSLYTLGVQGRLWRVWALLPAGAVIVDGQGVEKGRGPALVEIPAVGTCAEDAKHRQIPNEAGVWFLKFTGLRLELVLISRRRRHVRRLGEDCSGTKLGMLDEHESVPPPPEPGGEEGDGEEE